MSLRQWFDTREVDAFAASIAGQLLQRVPPATLPLHTKKEAERLLKVHAAIFAQAATFSREQKLNFYKKARLGNQFRWALKDAGYPPQFVDVWTYGLVAALPPRGR